MRFVLIEKRAAETYKEEEAEENNSRHASQPAEDNIESGDDGGEEDPLLGQEGEDYQISPNQRRFIKAFPIIYCLKNPRLLAALFLTMVHAVLLGAFDATIPTIAVEFFHMDPSQAGLLFTALIFPYLILGPVAGWLVDRYGTKPLAVLGYLYLVPALVLLRLVRSGGTPEISRYCFILALSGAGMAFIASSPLVEASFVVQKYHKANPDLFGVQGPYAQLYALSSMAFSFGLTLGPLASGALKDRAGYGNMNAVIAGLSFFTAGVSFVWVGDMPKALRRMVS